MAATMDAISGGRMELGIGAGWKREEWLAYGYGFPETPVRLAMLHDALEVISRMLEPGKTTHATYEGRHHQVADARNVPKPVQPNGMPIMVGGNGPNVTWRLAARYADELNVDGLSPDEVREALPTIRVALRGDRPRPRLARRQRPHLVGDRRMARRPGRRDASCCARTPTSA